MLFKIYVRQAVQELLKNFRILQVHVLQFFAFYQEFEAYSTLINKKSKDEINEQSKVISDDSNLKKYKITTYFSYFIPLESLLVRL